MQTTRSASFGRDSKYLCARLRRESRPGPYIDLHTGLLPLPGELLFREFPQKYRKISCRRFRWHLIDHTANMPAVICRVIDHVKHDLAVTHRPVSAAYESEVHDCGATALLHVIRILDMPLVHVPLRGAKLRERRALVRISGSEPMPYSLKVRPPHEIHHVNVIQRPQDAPKTMRWGFVNSCPGKSVNAP